MRRVFIGGTGRSGTTVLQHVLSFHKQLYTVPIETKFIVQSDGLYSVVKALSDDYAITDASIAIARFKTLMYEVITHKGDNPYADMAGKPYGELEYLPQEIFPNYWRSLYGFFNKISHRYYKRQEIVGIAAALVDSLFSDNAVLRDVETWVEKTPSNLFRIEFLAEMFPDALFINCVRDPRGVLDSFMRKQWLSGSLEEGARYLASYYEYVEKKRRFGQEREGLYYEVRLESLVLDPVAEMEKLLDFLGVDAFSAETNEIVVRTLREGGIRWSDEKGTYCDTWERSFSADERWRVSRILDSVIREYGYVL